MTALTVALVALVAPSAAFDLTAAALYDRRSRKGVGRAL
jgi:hypothetical protein